MNPTIVKSPRSSTHHFLLSTLAAAVLALSAPGVQSAQPPGIYPINSKPLGHSYGEWAASFWQWALSIPADRNPLFDTTGEFAGEGQSGPMWFLPGTFGAT